MNRQRLDKLLANLGYGSRADVQRLAEQGQVRYGGLALYDLSRKMSTDQLAAIRLAGQSLDPLSPLIVLLHKPIGFTCSHQDSGPLVYELLPARFLRRNPKLVTIGRLDKDTSGLLLLSDDGALVHRLTAPKSKWQKLYRVNLAEDIRSDSATIFASGALVLKGERQPVLPASLRIVDARTALIGISEGRYHQIRRMFAAVGNHVEALHRVGFGPITLPADLECGDFRLLDAELFSRQRSAQL